MTFHHRFSTGHRAVATVTNTGLRVEWDEVPEEKDRPRVKAEYEIWIRDCFLEVANRLGGSVLYCDLANGNNKLITPPTSRP